MAIKVTNNATSVLAAAINTSATLISVAGGDAALFPTFGAGDWCPLTIVDSSGNREIVRATARTGANITVVRAQEGTIARAFPAGARVDLRVTAAIFEGFQTDISSNTTAIGTKADDTATTTALGTKANVSTTYSKTEVDNIAVSAAPASAVAMFARQTAPTGWLKANGAAISRTTYAALFAAIGTNYGGGDGSTTFNLPDLRGEFLRSWDDGRGVDSGRNLGTAQSSQNLSHSHTGITDTQGSHTHTISTNFVLGATDTSRGGFVADGGTGFMSTPTWTASTAGAHTHTVTVNADGGSEARPRNIALLACIKF